LAELLRRHFGDTRLDLLDVGCGNGMLHGFLLASGLPFSVTGIDVAAEFMAAAREANPQVTYDTYEGGRLPYEDASFDAVFTICVMHHVPPQDWPRFLAEMRRVVRPGGLVLVFEHNPLNPLTRRLVRNCAVDENAVLLKPALLDGLMRDAGIEAVRLEFIIFTPFASAVFRRLDRVMSPVPLGAQYVAYGRVA
jgi:SAM-dependent methyltransferase